MARKTAPRKPEPELEGKTAKPGKGFTIITPEELAARIDAAKRDGSYGPGLGHLCTGCREFVPFTVYTSNGGKGVAGTIDLCPACYKKIQGTPDAVITTAKYIRGDSETGNYAATLEDKLLMWAAEHYREAFDAFANSNDREWEDRVLAAIVRKRAAGDSPWLVRAAEMHGDELRDLSPYITRAGGYPIAGQTFAEWVDDVGMCSVPDS